MPNSDRLTPQFDRAEEHDRFPPLEFLTNYDMLTTFTDVLMVGWR